MTDVIRPFQGQPTRRVLADETFGARILAWADALAGFSETPDGLTCTYFSGAHQSAAQTLQRWMGSAGLDASIDAVGNVTGRLACGIPNAQTLIIGSHYDTVRNAGRYDGRLGILMGIVIAEHLVEHQIRLPFDLDIVAFSEEEGIRFGTPFIGSRAVAGTFDPALLQLRDQSGRMLADLLRAAGRDTDAIPALARPPASLRGYLEVHIEQGPVLLSENLPVGVVSAIDGSVRQRVAVEGQAGHSGTVPMAFRRDAAVAAAELVLAVERHCAGTPWLVGTVGELAVRSGAINVIPGRCDLSIDVRAGNDRVRDDALTAIAADAKEIAARRRVAIRAEELLRVPAAPCAPSLRAALSAAIEGRGLRAHELASGAGHDAMMFHGITDVGMLFVRCGNGGISHSPLESVTAADVDVAAHILLDTLLAL